MPRPRGSPRRRQPALLLPRSRSASRCSRRRSTRLRRASRPRSTAGGRGPSRSRRRSRKPTVAYCPALEISRTSKAGCERPPDRRRRPVVDVLGDLERDPAASRDPRQQARRVGRRDREDPVRLQQPVRRFEEAPGGVDVLEGVLRDHEVEARRLEARRSRGRRRAHARRALARERDGVGGRVDAPGLVAHARRRRRGRSRGRSRRRARGPPGLCRRICRRRPRKVRSQFWRTSRYSS